MEFCYKFNLNIHISQIIIFSMLISLPNRLNTQLQLLAIFLAALCSSFLICCCSCYFFSNSCHTCQYSSVPFFMSKTHWCSFFDTAFIHTFQTFFSLKPKDIHLSVQFSWMNSYHALTFSLPLIAPLELISQKQMDLMRENLNSQI